MITDEIKISLQAGGGGDGLVTFDKTKGSQGPTGGKGGWGGNVYFQGVSDLTALNKYLKKKSYEAENGKNGSSRKATGPDGKDLILTVPVGSVIKNLTTLQVREIIRPGEKFLAAKGGLGGRGNFYFRSPVNTSPKKFEKGSPGEKFDFFIELRLIADAGFIGLPNAGKSSLLNQLTRAQAKVANYHFTTLEPNLGTLENFILADIPGLIEGASSGRGLGIKFLKHIRRTRILFHCLSLEAPDLLQDYQTVRKELGAYHKDLTSKREVLIFTKADLLKKAALGEKIKPLKEKEHLIVSIFDPKSLKKLKETIKALASSDSASA